MSNDSSGLDQARRERLLKALEAVTPSGNQDLIEAITAALEEREPINRIPDFPKGLD
ncbi:MAG: hypothetical protein AB8E74_00160 [Prochlorococcus sp.]|nr:hypothetical protein [Prochlorococcaceae cyanobacterium Fu_MAG_50]